MSKYYAQLNSNNVCIAVSALTSVVDDERLVQISGYDEDFLFRSYDSNTQTWSEDKYVPDASAIELSRMEALEQDNAELWYEIMLMQGGGVQ